MEIISWLLLVKRDGGYERNKWTHKIRNYITILYKKLGGKFESYTISIYSGAVSLPESGLGALLCKVSPITVKVPVAGWEEEGEKKRGGGGGGEDARKRFPRFSEESSTKTWLFVQPGTARKRLQDLLHVGIPATVVFLQLTVCFQTSFGVNVVCNS